MPNLINRKKQMILFTIILFIFSCQLSLAQEEAQEIKIENKNEFIQEETQLSTENLPKEEVTTITETPKQEKASTTKKKSSKKKKRKTEQSNSGMQTPQTLSDEEKTKKERDSKRIAYFILFAICLYIVYKILSYRHRRKCDHCGKWAAMKKTGTYCVDKKAKKIKEELKTRDGKGNVIRSREVLVDATTYFYETHRKCKYCGFEDVLKSSETKKN
ncbi:hypothetical protein [Capnocytophaga gingivalis]|uniref:hypothetical protein n=1 Tax=Capnocytophaga gingivalis TaxID=1017 RepID=UPI0023F0F6AA|nr:hypothetical protein [Capnocytophaga gingivalis]